MKKIAIIGGGVGGMTAAIYALRANAEVTIFDPFGLGGQVANLRSIRNYPSYKDIQGWELANNIAEQVKALGAKVIRQRVISLTKQDNQFVITTEKQTYSFFSVVVATGTTRNKLGIENAYIGKGVSYCATCDGNFYKDKPVAVVGSGKVAVSEALYLADLCSKVYVIANADNLEGKAEKVERLLSKQNVVFIPNARVTKILGGEYVSAIEIDNGETSQLQVDGIFVAVGSSPATGFIKLDVETQNGYIVADSNCSSNVNGLFAAGDVTANGLKQIVTACADGAKAGTYATAYAASQDK